MDRDETIAALRRENEILRAERDHWAKRSSQLALKLSRLVEVLYPEPVSLPDGRKVFFKPQGNDVHEWMQMLSDRIRAICFADDNATEG